MDTTTPGGRLVFHVFAALAEFIRELIVEGTREDLEAARQRHTAGTASGHDAGAGPPRPRPAESARQLVASIARLLGVSRSTLYKHVPELSGGRTELQEFQ